MGRLITRRILLAILVIFGVTVVTFVLSRVVPANVAYVWAGAQGFKATPAAAQQAAEKYHLNDPLYTQYGYYLRDLVTLHWGTDPVTGRAISADIRTYLPNTAVLAASGMILALLLGIPLGVLSAVRQNSIVDHLGRLVALFGVSAPGFWVGIILQLVFYYYLGWVADPGGLISNSVLLSHPVSSVTGIVWLDALITGNFVALRSAIDHLWLPAVTLALPIVALISRMLRASMLEVLREDFIRTARSKGLRERRIVYTHALRNALLPTLTVVGLSFGWLLTGAVVVEIVFAWPGIGSYAVNAVLSYDFPAIVVVTALFALIFVVVNLITDIAYAYLDPRVRV